MEWGFLFLVERNALTFCLNTDISLQFFVMVILKATVMELLDPQRGAFIPKLHSLYLDCSILPLPGIANQVCILQADSIAGNPSNYGLHNLPHDHPSALHNLFLLIFLNMGHSSGNVQITVVSLHINTALYTTMCTPLFDGYCALLVVCISTICNLYHFETYLETRCTSGDTKALWRGVR